MKNYTRSEQLLMDIYDSSLSDNGDRNLYPCNKIADYFKSKGVNIIELEDEWEDNKWLLKEDGYGLL